MKKHWILTLCLSWLFVFGLSGGVQAQTDSDGDLNADSKDPFPLDPSKGGVYVGGTITYDVLMTGDLDATGFTGTVITIATDGVTFDGNGHKIIAPNAGTVISLTGRNGVTVDNVTVAGNAASPSGTGIDLSNSSNNTVTNSNASYRANGIHVHGISSGNIINNNTLLGATAYGIVIDLAVGTTGGNQLSNNDVQNSVTGIYIGRDSNFQLTENILGNNSRGIWFVNVSNRAISNLVFPTNVATAILLDQVTGFTIDNVTVAGNAASPSGTGIDLSNSSNNTITNSDVSNKLTGIQMSGASTNNVVTHNNIFGNGRNISSALAIELSLSGQGNYWGHSCPGPLFVPGVDSNTPNVVDSFPFSTFDGWLGGGSPGCTVADAGPDKAICAGQSVQIGGNPAATGGAAPYIYSWSPIGGLGNANVANPIASPTQTTTYTLTATDANGFADTDEMTVTIKPSLPGTVGWWPGDGNTTDIQGGKNGVLQNGATFATGFVGQAFSFDGVDDYVDLSAHTASLNFAQPATIDAWVKSTADNDQVIFSISDGNPLPLTNLITMGIGNGFTATLVNELITVGRIGASAYIVGYTTPNRMELFDGNFHHIAVTFDGSKIKIYLDGVEKPVSVGLNGNNGIYGPIPNATKAYIGAEDLNGPFPNIFFDGLIDEFELHNVALTAAEIQSVFNAGSAGKCKIMPPTADAGPDKAICAGQSVQIGGTPSATGGTAPYTYSWTPATGLNNAGAANPTASPAVTTIYTLTVTDANGKMDTDEVTVTVNPLPVANAGADRSILYGHTMKLGGKLTGTGGTPPYTYSWTPATNLDDPTAANPRVRVTNPTTYTVTVTDAKGCQATDQITVMGHKFVFLADNLVKISQNKQSSGNIHSNGAIEFGQGTSPGKHTGNLTAIDDIIIGDKNTIVGNATSGNNVDLSGSAVVTGTITENANVGAIPFLPELSFVVPPTARDVTVPKNGTLNLLPGVYGDVKVKDKGKLFLSAGDYFMNVLDTDPSAILSIDVSSGPVDIHVVEELVFDSKVKVLITGTGAATHQVSFLTRQGGKLEIGKNATVQGAIIAPAAEVHFSTGSTFKGSVVANAITLDSKVAFSFHSPGVLTKESGVEESDEPEVASDQLAVTNYQLAQNYPNPFNPSTSISFALPEAGKVTLRIYSFNGQLVRTLADREMPAGRHQLLWNGQNESGRAVAAGIYLYRIIVQGQNGEAVFTETRRMTFLK